MSLVQHVSALEGVDREPDPEITDDLVPIRRKISYDVFQPPSQAPPILEQIPGTPAYKHSLTKRIGMIAGKYWFAMVLTNHS